MVTTPGRMSGTGVSGQGRRASRGDASQAVAAARGYQDRIGHTE
jgi:hypothetical protein